MRDYGTMRLGGFDSDFIPANPPALPMSRADVRTPERTVDLKDLDNNRRPDIRWDSEKRELRINWFKQEPHFAEVKELLAFYRERYGHIKALIMLVEPQVYRDNYLVLERQKFSREINRESYDSLQMAIVRYFPSKQKKS